MRPSKEARILKETPYQKHPRQRGWGARLLKNCLFIFRFYYSFRFRSRFSFTNGKVFAEDREHGRNTQANTRSYRRKTLVYMKEICKTKYPCKMSQTQNVTLGFRTINFSCQKAKSCKCHLRINNFLVAVKSPAIKV